jgi:hypothetical protein
MPSIKPGRSMPDTWAEYSTRCAGQPRAGLCLMWEMMRALSVPFVCLRMKKHERPLLPST